MSNEMKVPMRLRGNVWQCDLYDKAGNRSVKSTGVKGAENEALAQAEAQRLQRELNEGMAQALKPRQPTLKDAMDLAFRTVFATKVSRKTMEFHRAAVAKAIGEGVRLDSLPGETIDHASGELPGFLTRAHFDAVVASQLAKGNSEVTASKALETLCWVLRIARENHMMRGEIPKRPKLEKQEPRIREYTPEEEAAIQAEFSRLYPSDPYMNLLAVILCDTGLRLGELLNRACLAHNGGEHPTVHVWDTKNKSQRRVPLTPRAHAALAEFLTLRPKTKDSIESRWATMRRNLQLDSDAVIHALRHTCATRLLRGGLTLAHVQRWLGHKDIKSTMIYVNLNDKDLRGGLKALVTPQTVTATVTEIVTTVTAGPLHTPAAHPPSGEVEADSAKQGPHKATLVL